MKVGDLVRVVGNLWSSYSRQDDTGIVVREASMQTGLLVLWVDGEVSLFARPDHLEVISESR
jgi:hypothetical protein